MNADNETQSGPASNDLDLLRWDEERMTTGISSIDEEHKELIHNVNELHRAHLQGADHDDIYKVLRFFGRYAQTHFRHEENLMETRQCPTRQENQLAHARFLRAYQELVSNFSIEADADEVATEIEKMAAQWLSTHISRVDAGLRDCPLAACRKDAGQTASPSPQHSPNE